VLAFAFCDVFIVIFLPRVDVLLLLFLIACAACVGPVLCFQTTQAQARSFTRRRYSVLFISAILQVYTFQTTTTAAGDEAVRLWVDGQLLIDAWATSRFALLRFLTARMTS
jgi:hypothetical protein